MDKLIALAIPAVKVFGILVVIAIILAMVVRMVRKHQKRAAARGAQANAAAPAAAPPAVAPGAAPAPSFFAPPAQAMYFRPWERPVIYGSLGLIFVMVFATFVAVLGVGYKMVSKQNLMWRDVRRASLKVQEQTAVADKLKKAIEDKVQAELVPGHTPSARPNPSPDKCAKCTAELATSDEEGNSLDFMEGDWAFYDGKCTGPDFCETECKPAAPKLQIPPIPTCHKPKSLAQ